MDRKNAFYPDAFGYLSHRHRGTGLRAVFEGNNRALEDLDTLFFFAFGIGFLNFLVDLDDHARPHRESNIFGHKTQIKTDLLMI